MFDNFYGNPHVTGPLERMIAHERIAQSLLFAGPEGVGKATLARRFAARLAGHAELIERDDLSLEDNAATIASRERWPADKRNDDPLLFASYPDFVTFAPDGPLRQLSIQQMRLLKERAPYRPLNGNWRVFLVDHLDRANENAANSLLKTLEEPPSHLLIILTAENAFDLLPTIRSRVVAFHFAPLNETEMRAFAATRGLDQLERRIALANGCPGVAVTLDPDLWDKRRRVMLTLLETASGAAGWAAWIPNSEAIARSKNEKLELYFQPLYSLLRDLLLLKESSGPVRNRDLETELSRIVARVSPEWIRAAVRKADEITGLLRRNIQKQIALDGLIAGLRELT